MFKKFSMLGWAVWLCVPVTTGVALLICSFGLPIIEPEPQQLPPYKFTFISVLMALGAFQYTMFFNYAETFRKVIDDEDFSPVWKNYKKDTDDLRHRIESDPESPLRNQALTILSKREEQIRAYLEWNRKFLKRFLIESCIRFVLIFSVGLGLLISLVMDIFYFLDVWRKIDPLAMSQSFLFASLLLFGVLFVFFVLALSQELSNRMESTRPDNLA
jgi:hypothetical protein